MILSKHYTALLVVIALLGTAFSSCRNAPKNQPAVAYDARNALIVDKSCVIFIAPDTAEIARMHAQNNAEDYKAWVNEVTWYPGLATDVLRAHHIDCITCHDKPYIVLKLSRKETIFMEPLSLSGDMILFNVRKKPFVVHSADFESNRSFILKYFDK